MKKCISRLITFINHLWRTLISTLVERWLQKHTTDIECYSDPDESYAILVFDDGNSMVIACNRREGLQTIKIHLEPKKGGSHDTKSD